MKPVYWQIKLTMDWLAKKEASVDKTKAAIKGLQETLTEHNRDVAMDRESLAELQQDQSGQAGTKKK